MKVTMQTKFFRLWCCFALCVLALSTPLWPQASHPSPLIAAIQSELRRAKPDITGTRLVDLKPGLRWGKPVGYVVVAVATGPHRGFGTTAEIGELFGVFLVDSTLTRVIRTLDVFPSRRIQDYDVWINYVGNDTLTICGQGSSYGDQQMRRAYPMDSLPLGVGRPHVDTLFAKDKRNGPRPCPSPVDFGDVP